VIQTQRSLTQSQAAASTTPSYAEIARTPPESQPSNLQPISLRNTTPSRITDTPYCTIDTSRVEEEDKNRAQPVVIRQAIEQEMRKSEDHRSLRCLAVANDPRCAARIRIICRNEAELELVKEAAQKSAVAGTRVLRDQLFPVKVDNINRSAILDKGGEIRTGAMETLGRKTTSALPR